MNDISVILTLLNEGEALRPLLDRLLSQSLPPREIVIVDGGSTDKTVEVLAEYASADDRIRFSVVPGVNIAAGRNIAIAMARCEIVAVTDGGCLPDSRWLEELTRPLRDDPTCDAVAGKIVSNPETRFEYFAGLLCLATDSGESRTRAFFGRSSAFRKPAWERVGGYPEWLYTAEDTLFARRFNDLGMKVAYAAESKLYWRPRRNLYKLGKMFFLYGVGNGHIENGDLRASLYWLRFHAVWFAALMLSLVSPWFLVIGVADLAYLFHILIRPAIHEISRQTQDPLRYWYVTVIVFVRSLTTHAGYLFGSWEYHKRPVYRVRLEDYRKHVEQLPSTE